VCTPTPTVTPTACLAQICVTKFNDANGNGTHDVGETGIAGWNIEITDLSGNVVAFMATGTNGTSCAQVAAPAMYTVLEIPQAGWTQTFPAPPGLHTTFVECGQMATLEFGNLRRPPNTPTRTPTAKGPPPD